MDSTKEVIQYMDIAGNLVDYIPTITRLYAPVSGGGYIDVDLTAPVTLPTITRESLDCSGNTSPSSSRLLSSLPSLRTGDGVRLRSGRVLESKARGRPAQRSQSEPASH
jgi:hypothetical protein